MKISECNFNSLNGPEGTATKGNRNTLEVSLSRKYLGLVCTV